MHTPSRARRIVKWTGAAVSLLIVTAWTASGFWSFNWVGYHWFTLRNGQLEFGEHLESREDYGRRVKLTPFLPLDSEVVVRNRRPWLDCIAGGLATPRLLHFVGTVPDGEPSGPHCRLLILPLAAPLTVITLLTFALFFRDRRRHIQPDSCIHCGYNLTGNTSGVCSECGEQSNTKLVS